MMLLKNKSLKHSMKLTSFDTMIAMMTMSKTICLVILGIFHQTLADIAKAICWWANYVRVASFYFLVL